jgi:hypothetical protein
LDGGHAFKALSKSERLGLAALMLVAWAVREESLLMILGVVAIFRAFQKDAPAQRDLPIAFRFAFLIITLTLLSQVHVPIDQPIR